MVKSRADYQRQWRSENREELNKKAKIYRAKNKDRINETEKRYRDRNKDRINEKGREWANNNREKARESTKRSNRERRKEALRIYGGQCVCCGEETFEFLQFDHINNDGAAHRKKHKINTGKDSIRWLRDNGWPKDIIQILCANCNAAKGFYGQCPHGNI